MNMKRFSMSFCLVSLVLLLTACEASQTSVRKVGSLDTGAGYSVFVQDDFAFVATNDGVVIINISDRKHPKKTALIDLKEAAFGVYAQNDLVFIAGPADGLVIANIKDKMDPKVIGTYGGGGINKICVHDQIAYASTQQGDLRIINIDDPSQPYLLGTYSGQGGMGLMVACFQDIVYFSLADKGLDVLDVSDPSAPIKAVTVARTHGAKDAQVVGDFLYLSCAGNGVRILDIVDPFTPTTIASFNNGGEAWGVGGDSKYVWVGDLQEGIEIYDISNPRSPVLVTQDQRFAPHDIFFDDDYVYLADQDRGFVILEYAEENH